MCWGFNLESFSMHIGILRTDSVRPEWVPTYGEYPDMFERLLLAEDERTDVYHLERGGRGAARQR